MIAKMPSSSQSLRMLKTVSIAVTARIGVYHGEDDPFIPDEAIAAFQDEMDKTNADCLFITIPGAVHAFTNPGATAKGEKFGIPLRYNELADRCSWDHMQLLLASAFAR